MATLVVIAPALLACLGAITRRPVRDVATLAVTGSLISSLAAAWLAAQPFRGPVLVADWLPQLLVSVSWRVETVTLALAILVTVIGALVVQFTAAYFGESRAAREILVLLALFETSMLGLVLADNLYLLFLFWEITGIVSFFLIGSARGDAAAFGAARHALLITSAGALPLLVAFIYLTSRTGTASLSTLLGLELPVAAQTIALALLLPAVVTKSAQVPLHAWLPGAMAAPTPVSAYLHSATMVKAGIILLLYVYPLLGGSPLWTVLVPIGAVTCVWGSFRALGETDIKLLMAWSTVSQLGLLTLTIGLGTDLAMRAAVLHLFAHAVFKAGLFLTVGGVDKAAGTRSLLELGGLREHTPRLFVLAAVLAGSMAGIPPLAGFLSKELVLKKAMLSEPWVHGIAISGIVLGSIGTVAYSSRFVFEVFLGRSRGAATDRGRRLKPSLLLAPAILAVLTLAAGPGAAWVDRWFLEPVTASVIGRMLPAVTPLSLWYGVNAALVLSLVIVSVGYFSDRILGLRMVPRGPRALSGARLFDQALDACQGLGARFSWLLASLHPAVYLGLALAAGLVATVPLAFDALSVSPPPAHPVGLTTVLLLAAVLIAVLRVRSRLTRVLLVSVAGFAVAFLYRMLNAPDLLLTQLLVEVLVTIFFALGLRGLPPEPTKRVPPAWRWARRSLAVGLGLLAGSLVFALDRVGAPSQVKDYYLAAAPDLAKGLNVVNVTLTDFRALDTLMETFVVMLAAFGVAGLVKGREWASTTWSCPLDVPGQRTGLLPGMSRLILPLAGVLAVSLLLKGHNEPGGGFVAGLAFGIASILAIVVAARVRGLGSAGGVSLAGGAVLLVSLTGSLLFGAPGLTHAHGELQILGAGWKWHTALLFDLGVVLAIAGGTAAATRALWPPSRAPSSNADLGAAQ
ncbi:MAG: hydrogen gas-evolving membrane-bound hydrogenase subunit E [Acidobacteriota bacterium]